MRFLCLHGLGANANVFETQLGPLREELGGDHSFDFLEGEYEFPPALGIDAIFPGPYFSWHPLEYMAPNTEQEMMVKIRQGLTDVKEYIAESGPYDGAMGFSQGAQMLISLMLEHQALHPFGPALFQVVVFFSGAMFPELQQLTGEGVLKIRVPTAHILGGKKDFMYEKSLKLRDACDKGLRSEYEHDEGHCIPRKVELVLAMTKTIRRTLDRAIYNS